MLDALFSTFFIEVLSLIRFSFKNIFIFILNTSSHIPSMIRHSFFRWKNFLSTPNSKMRQILLLSTNWIDEWMRSKTRITSIDIISNKKSILFEESRSKHLITSAVCLLSLFPFHVHDITLQWHDHFGSVKMPITWDNLTRSESLVNWHHFFLFYGLIQLQWIAGRGTKKAAANKKEKENSSQKKKRSWWSIKSRMLLMCFVFLL